MVYEARQESIDRQVAVKTLHPEYARQQELVVRFFNEAKYSANLHIQALSKSLAVELLQMELSIWSWSSLRWSNFPPRMR